MNERIKELVHQTDAWCEQNLPANWTDDVDQYLPLWNAKFAELIVRECCLLTEEYQHCDTFYRADQTIKKHFGVEE